MKRQFLSHMTILALCAVLVTGTQTAWAAEDIGKIPLGSSDAATSDDESNTDSGSDTQPQEDPQPEPEPEPQPEPTPLKKTSINSIDQIADGIQIKWKKVSKATSYTIARTDLTASEGTRETYITTNSTNQCYYQDNAVESGHIYRYTVTACPDSADTLLCSSSPSKTVNRMYIGTPYISSAKHSKTTYKIIWESVQNIDGYQIQYSSSPLLLRSKSTTTNADTVTYSAKKVSSSKTYYARVRAYLTQADGSYLYGPWSYSKETASTKTTKVKILKAGDKSFELRAAAAQKMFAYDTLQGSCTDGTFGYFALHNKSNNKGKIIKVDMTNMRILKISKALNIYHANDLCYDPMEKQIVVVNAEGNGRNLTCINADTLKLVSNSEHKLSANVSSIPGAAKAKVTKISGIAAIAYNSQRDLFVVTLSNTHDFLILNRSFKPLQYLRPSLKSTGMFQGMECSNDMLMVCTSPNSKQGSNALFVYDWDGTFVSRLNINNSYELESLFYKGGRLYASFYRSWYEQVTKTRTALKTKKRTSSAKGKIIVKWTKKGSDTKYKVYYRVAGKKSWKSADVSGTKNAITLKKLKKKKRYEIKVKAITSTIEFRRSGYTYKLTSV